MSIPKPKSKPTLTLPSSAFLPLPSTPKRDYPLKIIDSHVHLWTSQQLDEKMILWPKREKLDFPHDLKFYSAVSGRGRELLGGGKGELEGFIFVQVSLEVLRGGNAEEDGRISESGQL